MDKSNIDGIASEGIEDALQILEEHVVEDTDNDVQILEEEQDVDLSTSSMQNTSLDPCVGMSFPSAEDAKSLYREYACRIGFGWKIRTSKKGVDGKVHYMVLACSREGRWSSKIPTTVKTLPTRVKQCDAKIIIKLKKSGTWYITKVVVEHSHELSPTKSRMFRVNKNMSMHVKRTILINEDAGVRINKTYRSVVADAGGYDGLGFHERDMRNYIHKERRSISKEGDGEALKKYFSRMHELNSNFFYEIDLDDDFHVKNVFWADARSRATYQSFGDVVTFDTTYLTNKYEMPFAAFVGVNHHGQSVLLGCGLLSGEDTESFVWLFESWLRCMEGKAPAGIVTDQCKAMQNAIQLVMPDCRHRWCLWHIMKKIPEKLKGYSEYKKIKNAMKVAVYDSLSEEEFVTKWCAFVEAFNLGDNQWLSGLLKER